MTTRSASPTLLKRIFDEGTGRELIKYKIMKKFKVTVTETLTKEFFVDAEDREDATNKVATEYYKASADEYILTASDYQGTTIKAEEL